MTTDAPDAHTPDAAGAGNAPRTPARPDVDGRPQPAPASSAAAGTSDTSHASGTISTESITDTTSTESTISTGHTAGTASAGPPASPTGKAGRRVAVPDLSLVVLIGATGSGKSTFARRHFLPTQVLSSDACRGMVSDDENDQAATSDAFDLLHYIAGKRLAAGRLTVVDATNVQKEARRHLVRLAREHDVLPVAVVLDVPPEVCARRNSGRPDRAGLPAHVVPRHHRELRRSLKGLSREGFRHVHVLRGEAEIEAAHVVTERRYNDLRHLTGPFDLIGDVHGCRAELEALLGRLGYALRRDAAGRPVNAVHPEGRTAVFVGDLVDRGPDSPGVLRLVMGMVAAGTALCVPGNHENKLVRHLRGRRVQLSHGLAETVEQLAKEEAAESGFCARVLAFLDGLVSHYVLDGGGLVVCHAGLPEKYHGRTSGRVRAHALYGDTTGETDEYGLPVRYPWAEDYRGRAAVVYGHTPTPRASWVNNTICLDTGCVFGGRLTALRWPERALEDVPAERVWYEPVRPLAGAGTAGPEDRPLDLGDVQGRRVVETRALGRVGVREENAAAALEVMSRFAIDPRLLPYLPPTMAPCATAPAADHDRGAPRDTAGHGLDGDSDRGPDQGSDGTVGAGPDRGGYLEHPVEAFAGYRKDGVRRVVCEEKHMGSRAVVLVCRDAEVARERFGATGGVTGAVYTRTGRPFFDDQAMTERILRRLRACADGTGLWRELAAPDATEPADWLLLDAELMPWSLKAGGLLRRQYAAVGAASRAAFPGVVGALESALARGVDVADLLDRQRSRATDASAFTDAYRRYCWPVGDPARGWPGGPAAGAPGERGTDGLDGLRLAPFQILAATGRNLAGLPHDQQLALIDRLVEYEDTVAESANTAHGVPSTYVNRLLAPTRRTYVDTEDEESVAAGVQWWLELTGAGGEGMVVKPVQAMARTGNDRLVQPGVKCRGREYLRIVYGPEYTRPEHLQRLRSRHLGHKRSLALREYALGLEALDRLAAGEPLWRVHEAVFAVLALESEPVDPRL